MEPLLDFYFDIPWIWPSQGQELTPVWGVKWACVICLISYTWHIFIPPPMIKRIQQYFGTLPRFWALTWAPQKANSIGYIFSFKMSKTWALNSWNRLQDGIFNGCIPHQILLNVQYALLLLPSSGPPVPCIEVRVLLDTMLMALRGREHYAPLLY